jgi:outer membrane lipoprotein carrier protein
MMSAKNLFLLAALLFAAPAFAAPEDALFKFFDHLQSLKADFTQQVFGPGGKLQQTTKGQVIIQRPGKFRWDYSVPYEQHIVADGKKIWFYDVDLEQVTIKPQDSTMANTPASLLSGAGKLSDQFDVLAVMREGKDWFELVPKKSDSGFEALYLMLDKDMIRVMELKDSFGQFTRIGFENEVINKTYPASTFRLDIPADVDVIDETAR